MHKNCHKSYLDSEPALHKCRLDKFLEVLFAVSPEGVKSVCVYDKSEDTCSVCEPMQHEPRTVGRHGVENHGT